eukprot:scaffold3762_cov118-Isochrysis_galbana.AAC.5
MAARPSSDDSTCVSAPSRNDTWLDASESNADSTLLRCALPMRREVPLEPACCGLVRLASSIAQRSDTSASSDRMCAAAVSTRPASTA